MQSYSIDVQLVHMRYITVTYYVTTACAVLAVALIKVIMTRTWHIARGHAGYLYLS